MLKRFWLEDLRRARLVAPCISKYGEQQHCEVYLDEPQIDWPHGQDEQCLL